MEKGIYIFDNATAFIDAIATLENQQHINQSRAVYLTKHLVTTVEVKKEIEFLNKCILNSFQGFKADKLIKLNITGSDGVNYSVCYSFNSSASNTIYSKLHRYLRKRQQIYI